MILRACTVVFETADDKLVTNGRIRVRTQCIELRIGVTCRMFIKWRAFSNFGGMQISQKPVYEKDEYGAR